MEVHWRWHFSNRDLSLQESLIFSQHSEHRPEKKLSTQNSNTTPTASDKCLCCLTEEETTMHLYQCSDQKLMNCLQEGLGELEDILQKRHAPSEM